MVYGSNSLINSYLTVLDLGYRHKPEGFFVLFLVHDIFIEQLFCARHYARHWDMVVNTLTQVSRFISFYPLNGSLASDQCICLPSGIFLILDLCLILLSFFRMGRRSEVISIFRARIVLQEMK